MKRKKYIGSALITILMVCLHSIPLCGLGTESNSYEKLAAEAMNSLEHGIAYYHSISIEGGYVWYYSLDLKRKWGDKPTDDRTIEVQPPGTLAVGMSFLRAYRVVDNPEFLKAAENAADALIRGQNDLGGWHHTIHVDQPNGHAVSIDDAAGSLVRGQNNPGGWDHTIQLDQPNGNVVSFDDDQTQSAIRLLMALNEVVDKPALGNAVEKSLKLMLQSQLPNGGWPHIYPKQGDYHDFATFNDGGINDCLSVMMDAHQYYGKQAHLDSINNAGWFIMISQLPPPQTGWIQQYNDYLQPAWGRVFEPPAVCPMVTVRNIGTLMDLYLYTGYGTGPLS